MSKDYDNSSKKLNKLNNYGILHISKEYIIDEIIKEILKLKEDNLNVNDNNIDEGLLREKIYKILYNSTHPVTTENIVNITENIINVINQDDDEIKSKKSKHCKINKEKKKRKNKTSEITNVINQARDEIKSKKDKCYKFNKEKKKYGNKIGDIISDFEQDYFFKNYNSNRKKLINVKFSEIVKQATLLVSLLALIGPLIANVMQVIIINIQSDLFNIPPEFIKFNFWKCSLIITMGTLGYLLYYIPLVFIKPYNNDKSSSIIMTIVFSLCPFIMLLSIFFNNKAKLLLFLLIIFGIFTILGFYKSFYLPISNPYFRTKELYSKYKSKRGFFVVGGLAYFLIVIIFVVSGSYSQSNNDFMLLTKDNNYESVVLGEYNDNYVIRNISKINDEIYIDSDNSFKIYPKGHINNYDKITNAKLTKNLEGYNYGYEIMNHSPKNNNLDNE